MAEMQCTKCGEVKKQTAFGMRTFRNGKRGLRRQCQSCVLGEMRAKRKAKYYRLKPRPKRDRSSEEKRERARYMARRRNENPRTLWDRLPEYVAKAAARGREYWPRGCRVTHRALKPAKERKPWHGLGLCALERHRLRWKLDSKYRLYHRLKRWMQKHLRDGRRSLKWSAALGYQPDELARHLERQFTKGMGWHNMGEWHIDHIVPVSAFSFASANDPEFRACYSLANLRPMWAEENLSKRATRTHLI